MERITLFLLLIVLLALATWQGYQYFYRTPKNLATVEAVAVIKASDLIQAFDRDSAKANSMYLGKIVTVQGEVHSVEKEDGTTVVLKSAGASSAIRCSMDDANIKKGETLQKGAIVSIKGNCTGYTVDELLGNDVILNRCVLIDQ